MCYETHFSRGYMTEVCVCVCKSPSGHRRRNSCSTPRMPVGILTVIAGSRHLLYTHAMSPRRRPYPNQTIMQSLAHTDFQVSVDHFQVAADPKVMGTLLSDQSPKLNETFKATFSIKSKPHVEAPAPRASTPD